MNTLYSIDKDDHSTIAFMLRGSIVGVKIRDAYAIELTYSDHRRVVLEPAHYGDAIGVTFYPAPYPDMLTDVDPGDEDTEPSSAGL